MGWEVGWWRTSCILWRSLGEWRVGLFSGGGCTFYGGMEEFKQSLEWLRRLDTLEVLRSEVEWRSRLKGLVVEEVENLVKEVVQFI